jgi:murein DD-endopeptidase MepM/ murein hydrolase activator NlpD
MLGLREPLPTAIARALPLDPAEDVLPLPRFAGEDPVDSLDEVIGSHLGETLGAVMRPARRGLPLLPRRHPKRRLGLLGAAFACAVVAAWGYYDTTGHLGPFLNDASVMDGTDDSASAQLADAAGAAFKPLGSAVQIIVNRNDTLDSIFRRIKLSVNDLAAVRDLPGIRASLDRLRPGDVITLRHVNGELLSLSRRVSETEMLSVVRPDLAGDFRAQVTTTPLETRSGAVRGRVESSLFEAVEAAGASEAVAVQLAERLYRDGKFLRYGDIIAAEFTNAGHTYRALRYALPGGTSEYFTPDGKSLRKAFLRSPLPFSRVSSGFGMRWHPILNRMRAHQGIDYAAPTGTPVRAAGNGRISFRGVKGGYGNVIVLRHGNGVETVYGHLSRFAKGLFVGKVVKQGEVIAAVGMTGTATGPHLHYEYRVNGVHQNPAKLKFLAAEPIPSRLRTDFQQRIVPLLAALATAKVGAAAAGN